MNDWIRRNLKRRLQWSDGITSIQISDALNGVDVYLSICGQRHYAIALLTKYGFDNIQLCDLQFPGEDAGLHNKKYGTLMVNLLIQAYKIIFPEGEHHKVRVHGETDCPLSRNDPGVLDDCKRRSHFWSRFGLKVKYPEKRTSPMSCTLAEFNMVDREIYPDFKTSLSLKRFRLEAHIPTFLEKDIERLNALDIHEYDLNFINEKGEETGILKNKIYKEFRAATLIFSALFSFGAIQLFFGNYHIASQLAFFFILTLLAYFSSLHFIPTSWVYRMPSAIALRRIQRDKKNEIDYLDTKLADVIEGDNRFIGRLYSAITEKLPELPKNDSFNYIAHIAGLGMIEKHDTVTLARMVYYIKNAMKQLQGQNSAKPTTHNDFLFGNVSLMSLTDLTNYCSQLGEQFGHHINRLLTLREGNMLEIYGSPSDSITNVLESLKDEVAYIELYASNPTDDIQPVGVKIYIRSGVLNFSRVWCTWKDSYFEYLLNALAPLFTIKVNNTASLISKTYILWAPSAFQKASLSAQDFNAFATEVADLSGARFSDEQIRYFTVQLQGRI